MRKCGLKSKPGDLTCRKYMFGRFPNKQKYTHFADGTLKYLHIKSSFSSQISRN